MKSHFENIAAATLTPTVTWWKKKNSHLWKAILVYNTYKFYYKIMKTFMN